VPRRRRTRCSHRAYARPTTPAGSGRVAKETSLNKLMIESLTEYLRGRRLKDADKPHTISPLKRGK